MTLIHSIIKIYRSDLLSLSKREIHFPIFKLLLLIQQCFSATFSLFFITSMISIATCGDLAFHGTLCGIIFYASYKNNTYKVYRNIFQESKNRHQVLHAQVHFLMEQVIDVCEEGHTILNEAVHRIIQTPDNSYMDYISVWGKCSQLKAMLERINKESERIEQNLKQCYDTVDSSMKNYERSKNVDRIVYRVMSSLLTGLIGSYLKVPDFLFNPMIPGKFVVFASGSLLVGIGFANLFNKCLSFEKKSMDIVNRRMASNVHKLYRKHSNFTLIVKSMMIENIDHYESLILKLIKYCDIQGNERRIARLRTQMLTKSAAIQEQFDSIAYDIAPKKQSKIRLMQYERNPLDFLSNASI